MDNFRIAQCRYDSLSQYGPLSASERDELEWRLKELVSRLEDGDFDETDLPDALEEIEQIKETLREEW